MYIWKWQSKWNQPVYKYYNILERIKYLGCGIPYYVGLWKCLTFMVKFMKRKCDNNKHIRIHDTRRLNYIYMVL